MPLSTHSVRAAYPEVPEAIREIIRQDISDVLFCASGLVPPGYDLHPQTRHDRRRNKALLRDWHLTWMQGPNMNQVTVEWTEDALQV